MTFVVNDFSVVKIIINGSKVLDPSFYLASIFSYLNKVPDRYDNQMRSEVHALSSGRVAASQN